MSDKIDAATLVARQALTVMSAKEVSDLWDEQRHKPSIRESGEHGDLQRRYVALLWAIGRWRFGEGFPSKGEVKT